MTTTTAALAIIGIALHLFAGWQTFRLMVVTDDTEFTEHMIACREHAPAAYWATLWCFLVFWPVIFLLAKLRLLPG
ncbi:hypothetical protein [Roseococcus pinisoli]|uniref:Uncharacterized protein n=1 Tax=Roseococcus pinisoli TaxID=2835040 RepID=A0ABS5QIX4_9PROT|nr:hypothetical protein [Roseococcus pinisoli]MBS7812857.1 hypothetical protein [Roseococcus pinisoli]